MVHPNDETPNRRMHQDSTREAEGNAYGRSAMTLDEYQERAGDTKAYPDPCDTMDLPIYTVLNLAGEAGEVAGKISKIIRDQGGYITNDDLSEIRAELGDVLWHVAMVADDLGIPLSDVAGSNLEKLALRKKRGAIQGSGDNR